MSVIQYYFAGYDIKHAHYLDPQDFEKPYDDSELEALAEEAAEDLFDNHDGWESHWPLKLELFIDGESAGVFEVELEHVPHFSSTKVKEQPHD